MKYVVFTYSGYGLPIAWKLQQEGQDVLVAQVQDEAEIISGISSEGDEERERRLSLYDGLLEKRSAEQVMARLRKIKQRQEFFAFFDLNHLFRYAEQVRDIGLHGNFPTQQDYEFEIDREWAKDFVALHYKGVRVGHHERFSTITDAAEFLSNSEEMWVLKGLKEDARTVVPDVDDVDLARGQVINAIERDRDEYESEG